MTARDPKYPWCTGAPRPVLISCADSSTCQISYYVAPIVDESSTAVISFNNVTGLSHFTQNDAENDLLCEERFQRDMICSDDGIHYLFFHNEYFRVIGAIAEERLSNGSNTENVAESLSPEMNR